MKLFAYDWFCPLCGRQAALIGGAKLSDVRVEIHGGSSSVCTKCAKNKKDEIKKRNEIYVGDKNKKKDINCKHEWQHPYLGRWYCLKCGATYNWLCGCGGSMFVCQKHYDEFIERSVKEEGSLENYLAKHSW